MATDPGSENPLSQNGDELLPELNVFFVAGSRHDKDRIEIQIGFDGLLPESKGRFVYDVDSLVFVPKTLGLHDVTDIQALRQEFQSYIRLHTHVTNPKNDSSLLRVKERLLELKKSLNMESLRFFAIEFEGYLKGQTKRFKKNPLTPAQMTHDLDAIEFVLTDYRSVMKARGVEDHHVDNEARGTVEHDLVALNEYLSHVYTQYLSELYYVVRMSAEVTPLSDIVEKHLKAEAQVRKAHGYLIEEHHGPDKSKDEDLYLRRIGLLKKYFQSTLFVISKGEVYQQKLLIPVYAVSAALAASWAIMIQLYQVRTMTERVGINSIALIAVAVAAYVFKDVMKDSFRRYFFKRSTSFFPDFQRKLFLRTKEATLPIGKIKEYIRTFDSEKLATAIKKNRYAVKGGELEEYLNEEVIHFKKRVTLHLDTLSKESEFPWGIREIIRYRLDRFLISMEDSFKRVHLISTSGIPSSRHSHRVYHVYFAVWIRHRKAHSVGHAVVSPAFKAFRVTLDKTGVIDCKQIPWDKDCPPPAND